LECVALLAVAVAVAVAVARCCEYGIVSRWSMVTGRGGDWARGEGERQS
jgi:hypothetical protein